MDELKEFNYDLPIFVCYVATENLTRRSVEEKIEHIDKYFKMISNIQVFIMATKDRDEIVCIHNGKDRNLEISELIDIITNIENLDDLKINLRDWKIKNIIN